MEYLNLSYNNFEGEVPTDGVYKNTSATFLEENSQLCGGILEFQLPKCNFEKFKKWKLTCTIKLIISIFFCACWSNFCFVSSNSLLFKEEKKR